MSRPNSINLTKLFLSFFLFLLALGCNNKKDKDGEQIYQAVSKTDTAILHLTKVKNRFYGKYQIIHSDQEKDSGMVRGIISGDTLNGSFLYAPYYNRKELKRKPIALLQRGDKLLLGKGAISVYMKIPFFSPDVPINYGNPEFIFEQVVSD